MYTPPQITFFYDESPPSSAQEMREFTLNTFPANRADEGYKDDHEIQMHPERPRHVAPFSYEYVVRDGQLAGLAEYNPDHDYLHFSASSRDSSLVPPTNASGNLTPPILPAVRRSGETYRSMVPPRSPGKTDKLKRVLSLSALKRRASGDDRKRGMLPLNLPLTPSPQSIPTPAVVPERQSLGQMFRHFGPSPPCSPRRSFEMPKVALSPPINQSRRLQGPLTPKASFEELRFVGQLVQHSPVSALTVVDEPAFVSKHENSFEVLRRESAIVKLQRSPTLDPTAARPMRRRESTSLNESSEAAPLSGGVEPVSNHPAPPSLPPFDFQLPKPYDGHGISSPQQESPLEHAVSSSRAEKFPIKYTERSTSRPESGMRDPKSEETMRIQVKLEANLEKAGLTASRRAKLRQIQSLDSPPEYSESKLDSATARAPLPKNVMQRAATTKLRPATQWGDVCMAQVKPVLMSPIIAKGHARMVSC